MQPIRISLYCPNGSKTKLELNPKNPNPRFFKETQIEALNYCVQKYNLQVAARNDFCVLTEDGHLLKVKNPQ